MKNPLFLLLSVLIFLSTNVKSQTYIPDICWIKVNSSVSPSENLIIMNDDVRLNNVLSQFNVTSYGQAMPFAKSPALQNTIEIKCSSCDMDLLHNMLNDSFPNVFYDFEKHVLIDSLLLKSLYTPTDLGWTTPTDWLWHLKKLKCGDAWDITRGNSGGNIAVFDGKIDATHPDLANKFAQSQPHNEYSGEPYGSYVAGDNHGTTVAGFAAGETTEQGSSAAGEYASAGFKTKMYYYNMSTPLFSYQRFFTWAVHASTVLGVKVMTTSRYTCRESDMPSSIQIMIKEILDNGTTIVAAAGNHFSNACGNASTGIYTPSYPFHPKYDSRIIVVTSTGKTDNHYFNPSGTSDGTHAHFPEVDICAPGYEVGGIGATSTGTAYYGYGGINGTSFAAPLTASVITLLYDVNPCFTSEDIEYIIKNSADPVADATTFLGKVGAGRINAFEAVKMAQTYGTQYPVTSNTVWNNDKYIFGDLVIESGGILTINNSLIRFNETGRITIKPGGKLIVDNSTLTSSCKLIGKQWKGIRVWGLQNQRQIISQQGVLEMRNNSIVEEAEYGISSRDGNYLTTNGGGIVQVNNTTFLNNKTDVEFLPYRNYHATNPTHELKNRSYFFDCTFKTDYGFGLAGKILINEPHMYLRGVNGVRVLGCTFEDKYANQSRRTGIFSSFASFEVNELCAGAVSIWPPPQTCNGQPTKFINLKEGIRSYYTNNSANFSINIKNSEFSCNKAIYFGGIDNAFVGLNEIEIKYNGLAPNIAGNYYGLYMEFCESYEVQENTFKSYNDNISNTIPLAAAVLVHNSHSNTEYIYKNNFDKCFIGIEAIGQNKDFDPSSNKGLKIKCNTLSINGTDVFVTPSSLFSSPLVGISEKQGVILGSTSSSIARNQSLAGNLFSPNSSRVSSSFNNLGDFVDYAHHNVSSDSRVVPISTKYTSGTVNLYADNSQSISASSCPSKLVPSVIGTTHVLQSSSLSSISALQDQLEILVDGGDPGLDDDVSGTTSNEVFDQYIDLRNEDGFLSIDVIREVVENMEFSNVMVRNILVANPHGAKEQEIQDLLDLRQPAMPSYMRYQINTSMEQLSAMEFIEGEISYHQDQYNYAVEDELRTYREDSIPHPDSITVILDRVVGIKWKYKLANHYKAMDEEQLASGVLLEIGNSNSISPEELNLHNEYMSFLDANVIPTNIDSIHDLDSTKILELLSYIGTNHLITRDVLPILALNEVSPYSEPVYIPGDGGENETKQINTFVDGRLAELLIYPNPSSDYATIAYKALNVEHQLSYMLLTIEGKLIKSATLQNNQDELLLNVSKLHSGKYVVVLKDGNRIITSKKLTIAH